MRFKVGIDFSSMNLWNGCRSIYLQIDLPFAGWAWVQRWTTGQSPRNRFRAHRGTEQDMGWTWGFHRAP